MLLLIEHYPMSGIKRINRSLDVLNILVVGSHGSGKMGAIVPATQSHFVLP
jgi:hypothetical protein